MFSFPFICGVGGVVDVGGVGGVGGVVDVGGVGGVGGVLTRW